MTQPFESLLGAEGVTQWKKHSLCKPDDQNLGLQNVPLGRGGGLLESVLLDAYKGTLGSDR